MLTALPLILQLANTLIERTRKTTTSPDTLKVLDGLAARVAGAQQLATELLDASDRRDEATLAKIAAALGE